MPQGEPRRPYIYTGEPARITLEQLNYSITSQPEFEPLQVGEPLAQEHCHLFQLPIEIRQSIYRHVFGPSLSKTGESTQSFRDSAMGLV